MLQVKTEQSNAYQIDIVNGQIKMNGQEITTDIIKLSENRFHMLWDHRSYTIEFVRKDETGKQLDVMVNGIRKQIIVADEFDLLLTKLGLDKLTTTKANAIKAPMPGLVISLKVKEGDMVKKGDAILVLEAMKMENIIKSPSDATIGKILVQERVAVEKNQVLVNLI